MPPRPARRPGFTLVEMLVALVVIGMLAALAIASYRNSTRTAAAQTVRADVEGLAAASEANFARTGGYVTGVDSYAAAHAAVPGFDPSPDMEWGIFDVDADRRGAVARVRWRIDPTLVCETGMGRRASTVPVACAGE